MSVRPRPPAPPSAPRPRSGSRRWMAAWALALTGCAHRPTPAGQAPSAPIAKLATDDDYGRVHADYDVLPVGDPKRAPLRDAMARYLLDEARRESAAGRLEEA